MGFLQRVNLEAAKRELRYLVIGGLAVNVHGYSRDTGDLDLLIEHESRSRWLDLFRQLGYQVFQDKDVFVQLSPPTDGAWPVDLMLVRDQTFQMILAAGIKTELFGADVIIPILEHLLALKLHALKHGNIQRYLKDYLDVENLIRINRVDMRAENIRQLFQKHGTMELYEKISRTSAT